MPNMRIIYENAVDNSTIVASSTAGSLSTSNLKTEYKGQVHRSIGTSVTYTINFATATQIGGVALPATNLSPEATIRVRLYNAAILVSDSGVIEACPGNTLELWNWSIPLNSNAFVFGGVSKTAVWFQSQSYATSCVIDIVDTNNVSGYIDCARIVAGPYWEPKYNISNGLSLDIVDTSSTSRNDSGDLLADRGFITERLSFDFSILFEQDKQDLYRILKRVGVSKNILVSIFPDSNSVLEQNNIIYGKRSNNSISMELFGIYKHSMELEGW